jgi:hypothetical protein
VQDDEIKELDVEGGLMRGDVFIAKRKEPGDPPADAAAAKGTTSLEGRVIL